MAWPGFCECGVATGWLLHSGHHRLSVWVPGEGTWASILFPFSLHSHRYSRCLGGCSLLSPEAGSWANMARDGEKEHRGWREAAFPAFSDGDLPVDNSNSIRMLVWPGTTRVHVGEVCTCTSPCPMGMVVIPISKGHHKRELS